MTAALSRGRVETMLKLGDVVSGVYFGVPFEGVLNSYDSSGYVYVKFPEGFAQPVVCGFARDGIALAPRSEERDSLRLVRRPDVEPEVKRAPWQVLGGEYLV